jgi:nucleotide-binding universal stress UspA family protein
MNIENVLVPVDFSPPSRLAVNYGVSLARKLRAKLMLMHVVESASALAHPFTAESAKIEKEHRDQAVRMLSALLGSEDQDDLDLRVVVRSGNIKNQIATVAREQKADIVVMGTHGRGLFGRWVIGSITDGMLRKISIPILTVCRATKPLAFNRILIATDLSESSKRGFDFVLELARTVHSDLVIVHVMDQTALIYGGAEMVQYVSPYDIEEAKAKVAELAAEGSRANVKIETIVVEGVAAEEILRAADRNSADLILLTVGKRGFVEHALLGTTAERIIREANVPVLSIPAAVEAQR